MPLQNRVTAHGEIVAHPARGTMFGNRGGRIHKNNRMLITRRWASRAWICCVLEFKGRQRQIMAPNSYTELFFLDEATALAAGHRPCFECRRRDALAFFEHHREAYGLPERMKADAFDRELHASRVDGKHQRTFQSDAGNLPDGTFIENDDGVFVLNGTNLLKWSIEGYTAAKPKPSGGIVRVLTPAVVVEVLRVGYKPSLHPTAGELTGSDQTEEARDL